MDARRYYIILVAVGAFIAVAIHKRGSSRFEDADRSVGGLTKASVGAVFKERRSGGVVYAAMVGSYEVPLCTTADLQAPPPKATVRLHVPSTIFADIATHSVIKCPGNSCVSTVDSNGQESYLNAANFKGSDINWRTPLDIDLDPLWKGERTITIEIVLDGSKIQFFTPRAPNADGSPDWLQAVRQGAEGNGMFYCLTPPNTLNGRQLSLRAKLWPPTPPNAASYGGLNIGILTFDPNNKNLAVPLYIDPQVHNNG